jgi:hypothetical protein
LDDEVERNEIGRACSTHGDRRVAYRNLREKGHLENPGLNGRIILKWIFRKWYGIWTGLI